MAALDFPLERLNYFLDRHTFVIQDPFGDFGLDKPINLTVKIELTGIKPMISVGDWKDFIEYTLTLVDIDSQFARGLFGWQFAAAKTNDYKIENTDTKFYLVTTKVNGLLRDFLKYFGIENPVSCTRIINKIADIDPKYMTEAKKLNVNSNIFEDKFEYIVDKLVSDVMNVFRQNQKGTIVLPEDLGDEEMVYDFPEINGVFTVNLDIKTDPNMTGIETDGESDVEDNIDIEITTNPELTEDDLKELEYELHEILVHELTHIIQQNLQYNFPKRKPKKPYNYYSQRHELEAQIAGFKRRAKLENKPFEEILRNWLKKYVKRHGMNLEETEKLIKLILSLI
jgi:hypothetical protein